MTEIDHSVDPRFTENIKAYKLAARISALWLAVVLLGGAAIGWWVAGESGMWSAVLGASAAAIFTLSTQIAAYRGAKKGPMAFVGAVAVTSVAKFLVVAVVALIALQLEWVVRPVFGAVLLIGAIGGLVIDLIAIQRARVPYVAEAPAPPSVG